MAEKKNNTSAPAGANTNKPAYTTVMLFSVNDIYAIDHFGRLAAFVKNKVKDLQPDAHYVTLNGDFLSPSLLSSIDKGKTKIDIMNQVIWQQYWIILGRYAIFEVNTIVRIIFNIVNLFT